jgi:hypothetical protein
MRWLGTIVRKPKGGSARGSIAVAVLVLIGTLPACGGSASTETTPPATHHGASDTASSDPCIASYNSWVVGTKYQRASSQAQRGLMAGAFPQCELLLTGSVSGSGFCSGEISIGFQEVSPNRWAFTQGCGAPVDEATANVHPNPDGTLRP